MKILYVGMEHQSYASRGHEVKVAETMAQLGHHVTLVSDHQPAWSSLDPQPKTLEFILAPLNDPKREGELVAMASALSGDFDACFASSISGAFFVNAYGDAHPDAPAVTQHRRVIQALDVPMWRIRAGDSFPWFHQWKRWFASLVRADTVIANTLVTKRELAEVAEKFGMKCPPCEVVYYGVDTDAANLAVPRSLARAGDTMGAPPSWVIGVSRLAAYKGFDFALASLSLMSEDERPGFVIVGEGQDGERLWTLASLSNVNTALVGGVSDEDKFAFIKGCDLGLFLAFNPSIPAQFPLECVYAGLPCVVADLEINLERFGALGEHGVFEVNPMNTGRVSETVGFLLRALQDSSGFAKEWAEALPKHRAWIEENRSFRSHARGVLRVLEGGEVPAITE